MVVKLFGGDMELLILLPTSINRIIVNLHKLRKVFLAFSSFFNFMKVVITFVSRDCFSPIHDGFGDSLV